MLLDRVAAIEAQLRRRVELDAAATQANAFRSRAAHFEPLARALQGEVARTEGLCKVGLTVARTAPRPTVRAKAEDLLAKFRADPRSLADADPTVRFELTQGVRAVTDELQTAAQAAWSAAIGVKAEAPSEDVLAALDTIAAYRPGIERLRKALLVLAGLAQQAPEPADVAARLAAADAALAEKNAALDMLRGSDLPSEVLNFLRKSGQGGAALADYTPAVDAWLTERGLKAAFRILPAARS